MSALEARYRRLLTVYPPDHRREYGPEMLGVLMTGARPGQRRPALGEVADLVRAGLRARLRGSVREQRRSGWRDAAAVVGLLAAVVLAAAACRRVALGLLAQFRYDQPMHAADGLLVLDVEIRTAAWLAVAVAALLGARRTAAWLAVLGALVEFGALLAWLPRDEFRPFGMSWSPVVVALAVGCLFAARPARRATEVLGRRGTALAAGAIVLAVASAVYGWLFPSWYGTFLVVSTGGFALPGPTLLVAAAMLLAALAAAPARVRRRILVLLSPVAVMPIVQPAVWRALGLSLAPTVTPGLVAALIGVVGVVPLIAFALGLAVVRSRESGRARGFAARGRGQVKEHE